MSGVDQFGVSFIASQARVNFIVIGKCIAVLGAVRHIVFPDRG